MILDRDTRSVLRGFQSHHRNAALERVYLPRREGGRGLHRLSHIWEREVVSLYVVYLFGGVSICVRKAESDEHLRGGGKDIERLIDGGCAHCPECFEGSPETTRRSPNGLDEE